MTRTIVGKQCAAWLAMLAMPAALAISSWGAPAARAADLRDVGRALVDKNKDAIVNVRIVYSVKISGGGQDRPEQEHKTETSGTVVTPDGLTLVALTRLDPASSIMRLSGDSDPNAPKIDGQVKDVKIVLGDKEIPATVVLRDKDLDIAFIKPTQKPDSPMKYIDLSGSAEPHLLDQVLVLARMGRIADRQIGAMTGEIQAIVTKPRKFYVPSAELASGGFAVPIFNADSKLVGFVMLRLMAGGDDEESDSGGNALPIVMPASQIAEAAKQAAAAGGSK